MKRNAALPITSLLSIILLTFHFVQDTLRARTGTPESQGTTLYAVPLLVLLLYGTVMLAGRRSGTIIMLVGSIVALGMPIVHMSGPVGLARAAADGAYFFIWTLMALGVTGLFSFALSVRELWNLRSGSSQPDHSTIQGD